ncbi:MAG: gamma carbonic anhydrase family protein [Lachnospiraceae bacterium]|nr:gamma carbonic anhydrase family protein [Lachnospiraceae bacterium]MDD6667838.1 gamma carbonic anhydrase family protein [Lachnospiraceae bacterium]
MKKPQVDPSVFIADGAVVKGDVKLAEGVSVWFNATIRADRAPIIIGKNSNIQDNAVLHVEGGVVPYGVTIGEGVTIGHNAIVHGCTVDDNTTIGMGAIVLNGAHVGKNCMIGAGALIPQNKVIPDNSLVVGLPGKVVRTLSEEEIEANRENALNYVKEGQEYKAEQEASRQ